METSFEINLDPVDMSYFVMRPLEIAEIKLPTVGIVSSRYGMRMHPITHRKEMHRGIDLVNERFSPLFAVCNGIVEKVGEDRYMGKYVILSTVWGEVYYAHCSKVLVKEGTFVSAGDIIALMGNTGRSTGVHLHFGVKEGENWLEPELLLSLSYISYAWRILEVKGLIWLR